MENAIQEFIDYLHRSKQTSQNTEISYERDLKKLASYLESHGVGTFKDATRTNLDAYILYMEKKNFASSTISSFFAAKGRSVPCTATEKSAAINTI